MNKPPHHSVQVASGAEVHERHGWEIPGSFGSASDEYEAFRNAAAVVHRSHNGRIEQQGRDALDLLNRLTTNELLSLDDGEARATVLTSDRGRVIEVFTVVRRPDRPLLLLAGAVNSAALIEGIDRYTIIEDSELTDITEKTAQIAVLGPKAHTVVAGVLGDAAGALEPGQFADARLDGAAVEAIRTDAPGVPSIELITASSDAAALWRAIVDVGATPAGADAYETVRIEQGVPASGQDVDERANPLEANLMSLIDFDKGCYVGQEVIARLDTYDKVQRRLVGLLASEQLTPDESLAVDGRTIGVVTSATASPALGRPVGLGYVRRAYLGPGTRLIAASAGEVEVAALPLVR
jgi:folate-binding protein YgfZ